MSASKTYLSNKELGLNSMGVAQQQRNSPRTIADCVGDNLYDLSLGGVVRQTAKRKSATAYIHVGVGGQYAIQDENTTIREFNSLTQQGQDFEFTVNLPVVGEMAGMASGWTVLIEVDEYA